MAAVRKPVSPGSRAEQILELVARGGPMTVQGLVHALGVTTTAVRQQVTRLCREGWLTRSQQHGVTGRPADVFGLSRQAERYIGGHRAELCRLMVEELLASLGPVRGRELLRRVGRRWGGDMDEAIGEGAVNEKVRRLAALLQSRGDLADAPGKKNAARLRVFACPYGKLTLEQSALCELERAAFTEVVGAPLKLKRRRPDGQRWCEFTVSAPARRADEREPGATPGE